MVLIREKLPAQVDAIKRELEESGVKMERAALEVQDELRTRSMRIESEDAEAAAGVWEGLYMALAPKSRKGHDGAHLQHWLGHNHSNPHSL